VRKPQVHLQIDALVLRGFDPLERDPIAAGLRTELARQLSGPAVRVSLGSSRVLSRLPVSAQPVTAVAGRPSRTGQLAAQHIVRGLVR